MSKGRDRRVQRTHEVLAQALIDLTLERGYEAVTIREITDRARVGYATFFRHYPDKDALLLDVLNVFLAELLDLLHGSSADQHTEQDSLLLFRYVQTHSALCRVLLSSHNRPALVQRIRDVGARSALATNTPRAGAIVPPAIAANHLVMASIALIEWWLEHDLVYTPERMAEIHAALIVRPALVLAFEDRSDADEHGMQ